MSAQRILVTDDDETIRFALTDFLSAKGYVVREAEDCRQTLRLLESERFDALLLDYMLPDGNALELLERLRDIEVDTPVIVLTAHGSIDLAVRAIKEGAEQFLTKPVELPVLAVILERILENSRNRQKQLVRVSRQERRRVDPFFGSSRAIQELEDRVTKLCAADRPVLIQGETGTGKGLLARWLHDHGPRSNEPFVDLNCAGLSREFLETELFGHEKGAFTGAVSSKRGLLEVAHRGTVFLDEVGDVDPAVQPKLLKVLEELRFRRMGDVRDRAVDVRIIAATNRDFAALVDEGKFRADLYYRISALPIQMPALRQRREDIPALAEYFLELFSVEFTRARPRLTPAAVTRLQNHHWPGNIRELRNVLERAVLLGGAEVIDADDLLFDRQPVERSATGFDGTLEELERVHIDRVLREEGGRVANAAVRLGTPRSTLYQKIKKLGISLPDS